MNENIFDKLDFGPLRPLLDNDDITDISFDNNGQIWVRSLTQGSLRVEVQGLTPEFVEKLAFQCSNVMGTTFNNAKPFLDAESAELRLNFVHPSIATNGIAMVIRKTPAKIRLEKEKLLKDDYFTQDIHDILIKCVEGHCNIIVCGETGSGKTEFVKYLASHTRTDEKIITIEDTLELHLDRIFPQRDIVAMKTNNVASYTDVLVTCMRQNPKWILLSEVRSSEAVSAVRNSISSGHNILSTIHADKASAIPYRMYSLMETDLDVNQFLNTIYRYIQIGVHIKAYYSKEKGKFHREVDEVCEFYVDEDNKPQCRILYQKLFGQEPVMRKPSPHLIEYLENQNIDISAITGHLSDDLPFKDDLGREEYMESYRHDNSDANGDNATNTSEVIDNSNDISLATTDDVSNTSNDVDVTLTQDHNDDTGEGQGSVSLPISADEVAIVTDNVDVNNNNSVSLPTEDVEVVIPTPAPDVSPSVTLEVPSVDNTSQNIMTDDQVSSEVNPTVTSSDENSLPIEKSDQVIATNQAVELPSTVDFSSLDNLE